MRGWRADRVVGLLSKPGTGKFFSVKVKMVNIFSFVGHVAFAATIRVRLQRTEAATGSV